MLKAEYRVNLWIYNLVSND